MDTPDRTQTHKRRFTPEEKKQLLDNLDIEVSHRVRQFESWLADALENFRIHQEGLISRIPKLVRNITLREFAKYNGDVQACLKGLQREKLGGEAETIDRTTRKRKWVESQEAEAKVAEVESTKGAKSARMMNPVTPKKPTRPLDAPGTGQRSRLPTMKTPGTTRTMHRTPFRATSPTPHKLTKPIPFPRTTGRLGSPTKLPAPNKPSTSTHVTQEQGQSRVPSTSSFNPALPNTSTFPRWPRKDERMLSVNGSPLANPLALDLSGWLSRVMEAEREGEHDDGGEGQAGPHKRTNSIIVRSTSQQSVNGNATGSGFHSRTNSQSNVVVPSQSHTRSNSQLAGFVPTRNAASSSSTPPPTQSHPQPQDTAHDATPAFAALVAVPTQDGHLLEFDPFQTTPGEIDALEGISDTAKRQAKQDIARLVMRAVEQWKIDS